MHLVTETIETLTYHGKTCKDVKWVGHADGSYACTWKQFVELAKGINYNHFNSGQSCIDPELVIVGDKWYLGRVLYDDREWWQFRLTPHRNVDTCKLTDVDLICNPFGVA